LLSPQVEGAEGSSVGKDVTFGERARIIGRHVSIGGGTTIGDDVVIKADAVKIGRNCKIENEVECFWRGGNAARFEMGDCSYIGRRASQGPGGL
jgi:UDP-3-O-[3-hydroxymyristoyl] glucosamine N-acyltransferase